VAIKVKEAVERIPVVGPAARRLVMAVLARSDLKIRDSAAYWEKRYRAGGNSGAGSYDRLAEFKAAYLNEFVRTRDVQEVLEFGCGDGSQLALAQYPHYVGCDVAHAAVELCRARFTDDPTKQFYVVGDLPGDLTAELVLSLDVIFHLVEDDVFDRYMTELFDRSTRFVVVYSSNTDEPAPALHVRHRPFTRWVDENRPDWKLVEHVPNPYPYDENHPKTTSFADFFVFERPAD
jgi:SAM-dependent methyltransferase